MGWELNIEHRTSNIEHPTTNNQHPTSDEVSQRGVPSRTALALGLLRIPPPYVGGYGLVAGQAVDNFPPLFPR